MDRIWIAQRAIVGEEAEAREQAGAFGPELYRLELRARYAHAVEARELFVGVGRGRGEQCLEPEAIAKQLIEEELLSARQRRIDRLVMLRKASPVLGDRKIAIEAEQLAVEA